MLNIVKKSKMKSNHKLIYILSFIIVFVVCANEVVAQQDTLDVSSMTREEVLNIPYDQLIDLPLDVLLQLAEIVGVSLDELYEMILNKDVTSASKKEESSFESPLSSSVISYYEIKQSGATCIEEALRLIPGVIVRQKTNGNYDVHIRGNDNVPPGNMLLYSENSTTLVMIDNRVVYNYAHGSTFWETLPVGIEDIDRIEVIRGASSALYGPNAASGVIHIITKRFEEEKTHLNVDAQLGTQNSKIVGLNMGVKVTDKLWINFSGNYHHRDRFQEEFYLWEQPDSVDKYLAIDEFADSVVESTQEPYERDSIELRFPDPFLGRTNYGGNVSIYYDMNADINFTIAGGYQNSDVISTPLDNPYYAGTRRLSESQFLDFRSSTFGLNTQVSYMWGPQDVAIDKNGMQYDFKTIDLVMEYDYKIDNLGIRPGFSYRNTKYDDDKYVDASIHEGFLNGERELSTVSLGLRLDYLLLDNIRLIGAIRGDKYNLPDKTYLTYQTVASYKISDKHMFRAVYARANRSPFVVDIYADYDWYRITAENLGDYAPFFPRSEHSVNPGVYFYFRGNKDLKLATMDLFEIGYRSKPTKQIQIDLEGYYNKTTNFDMFQLDSLKLFTASLVALPSNTVIMPIEGADAPIDAYFNYQNLDLVSIQKGVSLSVTAVVTKDLYFRIFGTLQKTKLENYKPETVTQSIAALQDDARNHPPVHSVTVPNPTDTTGATGIMVEYYPSTNPSDSTISITHKTTPQLYGGLMVNYKPFDKLNINASVYGYTYQTLVHSFEDAYIGPKIITNVKVCLKVWKDNTIYFNARNVFNNTKREFAFMDDIGGMYLVGMNLHF